MLVSLTPNGISYPVASAQNNMASTISKQWENIELKTTRKGNDDIYSNRKDVKQCLQEPPSSFNIICNLNNGLSNLFQLHLTTSEGLDLTNYTSTSSVTSTTASGELPQRPQHSSGALPHQDLHGLRKQRLYLGSSTLSYLQYTTISAQQPQQDGLR